MSWLEAHETTRKVCPCSSSLVLCEYPPFPYKRPGNDHKFPCNSVELN